MNCVEAEFLIELNDEKPTESPPEFISDYIQGRRILPAGSPRPGPIDLNIAPAMIEPMNCMGPYSGINHISMMKGVQIFCTTNLAEHPIAYYMDACPAEILYCTATLFLLDKWTKRLEPLIDSCGYRHKIVAQVENTKSRKTGDKMFSKEYSGGSLSMGSLQAPAGMRSESNQIVIIDEADGAPKKVTTGEGSFIGLLRGRTAAYGSKYKIMELSTPSTYDDSVIYPQFLAGDQRYYNMPCPRCGAMIVFEFDQLQPEFDGVGHLESVWYECQECKKPIKNNEKTEMMAHGVWVPTAIPKNKKRRSYHINSLYSPVGFMSWQLVYEEFLNSEEDSDLKPDFTNLYLGLPYKEDGQRPDITKKNKLRGEYLNGTVPQGVLFLTMAGDVQLGKVKYQKMTPAELAKEIEEMKKAKVNLWKANLPRIEFEVYGEGEVYRSWSIDYKVFYGHTTMGPYEGAFEEVYQWIEKTELQYRRSDGQVFIPVIGSLDASEGVTSPAVFAFCERVDGNIFPNINYGWLDAKKDKEIDKETSRDIDRHRFNNKKGGGAFIQMSTNYYRKQVYERLKVERELDPSKPQRGAFCDFPVKRADHYFKMLTNAEQMNDGSFNKGGRPCEAIDCRTYNLCIATIWLEQRVKEIKKEAEARKCPVEEIEMIDKKMVLAQLAAGLGRLEVGV